MNSPFSRESLLETEAKHTLCTAVRFQDVDAAQIMFFARFFDLFHDVYVDLWNQGSPTLVELLQAKEFGLPLMHTEADYLRPLRFGAEIKVSVVGVHPEARGFWVGYRVSSAAGVHAIGSSRHAVLDLNTKERVEALPNVVAEFLRRLS